MLKSEEPVTAPSTEDNEEADVFLRPVKVVGAHCRYGYADYIFVGYAIRQVCFIGLCVHAEHTFGTTQTRTMFGCHWPISIMEERTKQVVCHSRLILPSRFAISELSLLKVLWWCMANEEKAAMASF